MSYLVLARKYRPQRFSELVGQEHVARTLTNAIAQNRVHHAFLFTGARGVGKTSAARILAKSLCCVEGPTAQPCGVCDACREIAEGRSVDIVEIDGASNTGVDDVRTLRESARYMPARARLKIYIIDEVHMLSTSAFNALLKTLEEPPPHVVFIFATTEVHKIPTTILSRCQRYDFKLIPTTRLVAHLEEILGAEKIAFEAGAVRLVARQAAGSVRDALSLLDQVIAYVGTARLEADIVSEVLGIADRSLLIELARTVLARDVAATLRTIASAVDRGIDLSQLARAFLAMLRDLEIASHVSDADVLAQLIDATGDEMAELRALATGTSAPGSATASTTPTGDLFAVLFDRWARAVDESSRAPAPQLLLEMALVDLCQAEPLEPLGDLLDRLESLEGRLLARASGDKAVKPGGGSGFGGGPSAAPMPRESRPSGPATALATARTSGNVSPSVPTAPTVPVLPTVPGFPTLPTIPTMSSMPPWSPGAGSSAEGSDPGGGALRAAEVISADSTRPAAPAELWRRVRQDLERRRPRIGALLATAHVLEADATKLVLGFADRADVDSAERVRGDIEAALLAEWGNAIRLQVKHEPGGHVGALIRAESVQEAESLATDRHRREEEARRHPMIQKVQDLFGVGIREIKT